MENLILASGSHIRATILRNAGVDFRVIRTGVDEDAIKVRGLEEAKPLPDIALELARAKADAGAMIAGTDDYVLGADQIMEFEDLSYDKPGSYQEARARLLAFRGRAHTLINAMVIVKDNQCVWHHVARPVVHLRAYSEQELDLYLEACDETILDSVAAYQIEHLGMRLIERIDGDHYAVLGLALSPLLAALREFGVIDF